MQIELHHVARFEVIGHTPHIANVIKLGAINAEGMVTAEFRLFDFPEEVTDKLKLLTPPDGGDTPHLKDATYLTAHYCEKIRVQMMIPDNSNSVALEIIGDNGTLSVTMYGLPEDQTERLKAFADDQTHIAKG